MSDVEAAWAAHADRVDALMAMTRERDNERARVDALRSEVRIQLAEVERLRKENLDAAERAQVEIELLRGRLVDATAQIRRMAAERDA